MLPMAYILINHLDNYARPLKCLNDQGGRKLNMDVYDNLNYRQPFPISFSKNCLGVLVTLEGRGPVSGASVAYTNNRTITEFTIVTDASNAEAKSDLFYIALGI